MVNVATILKHLIDGLKKLAELLHLKEIVMDQGVQTLIWTITQGAIAAAAAEGHPEAKGAVQEVSKLVIEGIDGKILVKPADVQNFLNKELEKINIENPYTQVVISGILMMYTNLIVKWFDQNAINDQLKRLEVVRAFAVVVNNAAGGTMKLVPDMPVDE